MLTDPDRWQELGVHWHAYVETSDGNPFKAVSTRDARLEQEPQKILRSPEEVAGWIASMTQEHANPDCVHLIGPGGGIGAIGDDGHVEHDFSENLEVLSRGDSLYYDFRRKDDRMRLWAEAVTDEECREVHKSEQES